MESGTNARARKALHENRGKVEQWRMRGVFLFGLNSGAARWPHRPWEEHHMATAALSTRDTSILTHPREFHWGAVIAGAVSAAAVSFILISLGSGIGLALASPANATPANATTFLTLGAVY